MEAKVKTLDQAEPKKSTPRFSPLALRAIAEAQAKNPKKDITELVEEASAIYDEIKKQSRVNGESFTRATAISLILKETPTKERDKVIEEADKLYCSKTGRESNKRETAFTYSHIVHCLKVFGILK
jgi:hypothetical protein